MKVRWGEFEFEVNTVNDLKLLLEFRKLLNEEECMAERKEVKEVVGDPEERKLEEYLKKNSDHPELREFAEWLKKKELHPATIRGYVMVAHKYIIHEANPKDRKDTRIIKLVKEYWNEFKAERVAKVICGVNDDYDLRKDFYETKRVIENTMK